MTQRKRKFDPHPVNMDRRISIGLNRKADRLRLFEDNRVAFFEDWFQKYGEAKRRKLDILYEAQDGKCCFCGETLWRYHQTGQGLPSSKRATLEHKLPKAHGGTDALSNLAMSCSRCNSLRGVIDFYEFAKLTPAEIKSRKERDSIKRSRKAAEKLEDPKYIARIRLQTFNLALLMMLIERTATS